MASFKAKTVQGVTGFALQKFILFIFGVSPIKTRYDNKSFIFFLDNSIFDKPENIPFIEKFEKDFLVKIKNIREF
jgi:hypothetical protein